MVGTKRLTDSHSLSSMDILYLRFWLYNNEDMVGPFPPEIGNLVNMSKFFLCILHSLLRLYT